MSPLREPGTQSSIRSPDATLVGRGGSAIRRDSAPHEARAARHMVGVMLAIAATLALTATAFLQMVVTLIDTRTPPPGTQAAECVEGDPEGCPADYTCMGSNCVPVPALDTCQVGDSCDTSGASCRCLPPLTCQDQVCSADLPTPACELPAVQKLLAEVYKTCGNIQNCPEDKLEDFIVKSADFDQIVTAFPGTITVHFPSGAPSIDGKREWPSAEQRNHYITMLSAPHVAAAIRDAQDVLLIGRSSPTTNVNQDLDYSRKRIAKVTEWLVSAAGSPSASTAIRAKLRTTILGGKKVLQPDFFIKHYANRIIAWDEVAEANLRAKLPGFANLGARVKNDLRGQINQVVFIIPISCKAPDAGVVVP